MLLCQGLVFCLFSQEERLLLSELCPILSAIARFRDSEQILWR